MTIRTSCWPEEVVLARFVPNHIDLRKAIEDIQIEEHRVYDEWRESGEVAWYCHGCPRISECYNDESGFKIHGLRHYQQR